VDCIWKCNLMRVIVWGNFNAWVCKEGKLLGCLIKWI
jgi:hypothetical protein